MRMHKVIAALESATDGTADAAHAGGTEAWFAVATDGLSVMVTSGPEGSPFNEGQTHTDLIYVGVYVSEEARLNGDAPLTTAIGRRSAIGRALAAARLAPRSYVVGLPVVITVRPDSTVTVDADTCEAADVIRAAYGTVTDADTVAAAHDAGRL